MREGEFFTRLTLAHRKATCAHRRSGARPAMTGGMDLVMEAAITLPAGPTAGLFAELGGAMFRRAARLLGDGPAAVDAAEHLFVRFVVHGNAQGLDARGRWNWIYRVVTSYVMRGLPDDARPGASGLGRSAPPWGLPPDMRTLRKLDEATQSMVVLSLLDGLSVAEIAEVLERPAERIRRKLASFRVSANASDVQANTGAGHPSMLALDRDRASHVDHILSCEYCRALVNEADHLTAHFAMDIAPDAVPRVAAAVRSERAIQSTGVRWRRLLWLGGGLAVVSLLALVVARPRRPDREDVPYAGLKGASRAKAAGIQITVSNGTEVRPLDPATALHPGERLYFRVRAEQPRYLELRVRDTEGDRRLFPVGPGQSVLVRPGQSVDAEYVVSAARPTAANAASVAVGKIWIVGLFADHPFQLDRAPVPEVEVVPVRIDVQP